MKLGVKIHLVSMITQTRADGQKLGEEHDLPSEAMVGNAQTVLGFAVLGCMVAGGVGIAKALNMERGLDVLFCLLGSVAAFGVVFYVYLRRR